MGNKGKKLVDEIREGLHDFELPYEEGNWENFQKTYGKELAKEQRRRRKTTFILWKYISAAAVLTGILIYIPWHWGDKNKVKQEQIVEHGQVAIQDKELHLPTVDESDTLVASTPQNRPIAPTAGTASTTVQRIPDTAAEAPIRDKRQSTHGLNKEVVPADHSLPRTITEDKTAYSSRDEVSIAAIDRQEGNRQASGRWEFGIEVNSSITADRPHFAAGVLTQFKVSEKIKLSTGLTYSRLSAMHDTEPVQLSYDTKMVGGESMIKALDIPLAIVYAPTDCWYASVGVSALAVLAEDKFYRMESELLRESVVVDPESGATETVFEVVKNEYRERGMDTDFEGRSNLGYLNLSIGRTQRFNKLDLLFEPYLKIPMGGLQNREVNLLNSGIKVKILF